MSRIASDPSEHPFTRRSPSEQTGRWYDAPEHRFATLQTGTPIVASTSIKSYAFYQKVDTKELLLSFARPEDQIRSILDRMEQHFRNNVSHYGLLIDDSLTTTVEKNLDVDKVTFAIKARVICPTVDNTRTSAPKRRYCSHCDTFSFEDGFHSGTCENCGAPYPKEQF